MVFILSLLTTLCAVVSALPQQQSCSTVTTQVIVPTTTYTFQSTYVSTVQATTAKDLGTFTWVTTVRSTKTIGTLTTTATQCTATGTITAQPTTTIYTSAPPAGYPPPPPGYYPNKRDEASGCTVTSTSTTTYGATYTYVDSGETSTYTRYTDFTQATTTTTSYGGTSYTVATATATTSALCGPTANATSPTTTQTKTQDARCAPTAQISAYRGYGLEWASDTPLGGATYTTTAEDASECCQLCAEADNCAASRWDIRSKSCKLEFPIKYDTGEASCDYPLLAYYNAGPNHPLAPGAGWWIGSICGEPQFGSAKPDDGT